MASPPSLRGIATVILVLISIITMNGESESHELRPSEHGLEYQNSAQAGDTKPPPEMKSFFGEPSASSYVAMPKAMNSNSTDDTSWWGNVGFGRGRDGHKDRERNVLLVASVACGVTGVALLVVSALLYVFKFQRQRSPTPAPPPPPPLSLPPPPQSSHDDSDNKLQIVVRD
jgi:hypothetical protein